MNLDEAVHSKCLSSVSLSLSFGNMHSSTFFYFPPEAVHAEMREDRWIPLFANVTCFPENRTIIIHK